MSRDSFAEHWTQKTFINPEDQRLVIEIDGNDSGVVLRIIDNEFYIPKDKVSDVSDALLSMAELIK
jgi:hypothetical protein